MKKIFALGFALLCLSACSSDDDSEPAVNLDNLQKRWYPTVIKLGDQTQDYQGHLSCGKDYYEFQANNVFRDVDYFDCQQDPNVDTGTYSATEETLSMTVDGVTDSYTLKKLSASRMEIQTTLNGATITYVYTSTP